MASNPSTSADAISVNSSDFLTRNAAAAFLGMSPQWLDKQRYQTGKAKIPFYRIGAKILYRKADLQDFLESCRQDAD